jgi:hypothetical protein
MKIPQSIRALRGSAGFLKIDCLLNVPRARTNLHRANRVRVKNAVPSKEQKRCCGEDTVESHDMLGLGRPLDRRVLHRRLTISFCSLSAY